MEPHIPTHSSAETSKTPSPTSWIVGIARAGAACLAAITFCAAAAAATANPLASPLSPGPSVETGKTALTMEVAKNLPLLGGASAAAGQALRATLARYPGLPPIRIALVRSGVDLAGGGLLAGSRSLHDSKTGSCEIVIVVDPDGVSSLASAMKSTMGFTPSPALAHRLGAIETIHEIGHCSPHGRAYAFDHPALSAAENKILGEAIKDTPLGAIWAESYSDAYALLHTLTITAPRSAQRELATNDASLLSGWRKMERDLHTHSSALGLKIDYKSDEHITEKSIEELLAHLNHWLDDSTPIESRAAQLASIGVMRTHKATDQPGRLAKLSLTLDGKIENSMMKLIKNIVPAALIAVHLPADPSDLDSGSKWFEEIMSKTIAKALPDHPNGYLALAVTQTPALARVAYEAAKRHVVDPSKVLDLDSKDIEIFEEHLMSEAITHGLVKAALSQASAEQTLFDSLAAKAWGKAERAEAASPSTVVNAKYENNIILRHLTQSGQATFDDKEVTLDKAALNVTDWRVKREVILQSPAPVRLVTPSL